MRVLIACEFSGIVREAFKAKGHDAWSCDYLPTEIPGQHHLGDVSDILDWGWDMMIAHPPCTYRANSSVRWLKGNWARQRELEISDKFFNLLLEIEEILKICMENPIPHKYSKVPRYTQIIQPWQFGHGETKATCLWLKNLPTLQPTNIVDGRIGRVHHEPLGKDRWKNRSRTYTGIAQAMADQWG